MMKRKMLYIILGLTCYGSVQAQQDSLILDLQTTVNMANSSSLSAFRAKNMYEANYWEFRNFKAQRLPALTLNMTPLRYKRDFTSRYDSERNIDVYRKQQSLYSYGNLSLSQNFDWLGGTFFVDSELGYFKNFGDKSYTQYSSVPVRVGYRQQLLGYNPFKWEKRIAPLKYKIAQKDLLYNLERTAEESSHYFFALAMAQAQYELAKDNVKNSKILYEIGQERHKIAGIRQSELLTLRLDQVNAQNSLQNAQISVNRAMFALASYLNVGKNTPIRLVLPDYPKAVDISVELALEQAKNNNPDFMKSQQEVLQLKQTLDRTKREAMFNVGISASVGFNQVAETLGKAYQDPLQQDIATLTLSVPLLDWGVRKGRYNMAKSNLNVAEFTALQNELKIEEDVIMTVGDFSVQQGLINSAEEALELAKMAYEQTRERFIIGKADINSLTLSNNRHQEAQRNYISALRNYWLSYFKIRRLTLYDFEKQEPITISFDDLKR